MNPGTFSLPSPWKMLSGRVAQGVAADNPRSSRLSSPRKMPSGNSVRELPSRFMYLSLGSP